MRDPNEYLEFQNVVACHFCGQGIPIESNADLDALILPEWACWAAGCVVDLDELGTNAICPACAEDRVGPGWRETARDALAFNAACLAAGCTEPEPRFHH